MQGYTLNEDHLKKIKAKKEMRIEETSNLYHMLTLTEHLCWHSQYRRNIHKSEIFHNLQRYYEDNTMTKKTRVNKEDRLRTSNDRSTRRKKERRASKKKPNKQSKISKYELIHWVHSKRRKYHMLFRRSYWLN